MQGHLSGPSLCSRPYYPAFGGGGGLVTFSGNTVGFTSPRAGSIGALVTTTTWYWGEMNVSAAFTGTNSISGAESLDIEAGNLTGAVVFNGAGNNSLTVKGNGTIVTGALSQSSSGNLSINIDNGGELIMTAPTSSKLGGNSTTINSHGLNIGSTGMIVFTVDPSAGNATTPQIGTATVPKKNT